MLVRQFFLARMASGSHSIIHVLRLVVCIDVLRNVALFFLSDEAQYL